MPTGPTDTQLPPQADSRPATPGRQRQAGRKARRVERRNRVRPPSRAFNRLLRIVLTPFFRTRYGLRWDRKAFPNIKGSYFVIGNHPMNWDAFLFSGALPDPAYIVAAESLFRKPFLRFLLLKLVGGIPKTKGRADMRAIRTMREAARRGAPILLFPEQGGRTWNGVTQPIIPTTAKLIKAFRLPVVTGVLAGGALSTPRWARVNPRRGRLRLAMHVTLTPEQIDGMDEPGILDCLQRAIHQDDAAWQARNLAEGTAVRFRGKRRAEGIERYLYACPACGAYHSIRSEGNRFRCLQCAFGGEVDEYGLLDGTDRIVEYGRILDAWLDRRVAETEASGASLFEVRARASRGARMTGFQPMGDGFVALRVRSGQLEIGDETIPLQEVSAVTNFWSHVLEFARGEQAFQVTLEDPTESVYFLMLAIRKAAVRAGAEPARLSDD